MNITLSWDLFIIVFFATVMAYSFIIGKTQSLKIIIASYISVVATQGIGNVLYRLTGSSQAILEVMGLSLNITILSMTKIILFIIFIILIAIRSGVHVEYERDTGSLMSAVYTGLFGFFTAGLIVSTILTYATGNAILDSNIITSAALTEMMETSPLMQLMILNQDLWFTLPALLFVGIGFIKGGANIDDEEE